MQVILLQRVEKLGKLGEVVNVRPGYARNFLLPKKVALRATKENLAHVEKEKEVLEKVNLKHKKEAETLAKRLEGSIVVLIRQASEAGQLYGSVSARDIAEALNQEQVTKSHVKIETPIKTIGIHAIRVQLHPEVFITVGVNVAMSEDEAKAQAKAITSHTETTEKKGKEKGVSAPSDVSEKEEEAQEKTAASHKEETEEEKAKVKKKTASPRKKAKEEEKK